MEETGILENPNLLAECYLTLNQVLKTGKMAAFAFEKTAILRHFFDVIPTPAPRK
jgi:hypothetical protein